ncbi:hypothetical protein CDAR_290111 [Caerostris darwini]|uniref:Uncharacterized protein n=1 Tax=Caerostris darwini TaxID=1538125 RepID=A0AAV4WZE3_9ARAC|nr:hypothetical protein CDAR_290111 [Caerostris darwini]
MIRRLSSSTTSTPISRREEESERMRSEPELTVQVVSVVVMRVVMVGVVVRHHLGDLRGHGGGQLVLLLPLHAPVLEPDLDLPLREAECVGDLDPPPPRQVSVEVEFLFQLQRLVAGVGRPLSLCLAHGVHTVCKEVTLGFK